ncbi:cyclin-dependent kinase regulatory subunit [Babesia ovis]|uniref:Cyclin-dependent kinases regulatory subunit n=1 Tax=Babesia ovis TaxID=5869 RepID=A0A9W5WUG3_BABOV|nr:cyclin-dependent kinase regulatory subunit [Babesia ovis]
MAPSNQTQRVLPAAYREHTTLKDEGGTSEEDGLMTGLRKHKLDRDNDGFGLHCDPLLKNGNKRVVIKSDSLKSEWLGLWKAPLRNPFNMYGTIPSRMRARDKRKTYSVPPLVDMASDSKLETILRRSIGSNISPEGTSNTGVGTISMDLGSACERAHVISDVQRVNTILSEPKSARSSISISTARSTVDSFRYSESFEDIVSVPPEPTSTEARAKALLNNLYSATRNGFLSGALPENPWKNKHQVDADFIAVSLARKGDYNPGLLLFHDLEAIVSAPIKYRNLEDSYSFHSTGYSQAHGTKGLGDPVVRRQMLRDVKSRSDSKSKKDEGFEFTSEDDVLIWNASTDVARDTMRRSGLIKRPVKYDMNDDFMVTDADDYAVLQTRFGRIIYSPKFKDERYMYRFVVLTKEAQQAVDALSRTLPNSNRKPGSYAPPPGPKRFLTEFEIVRQLGIQMSPGWEHFMYFKNTNKELVLRKRL